MREIKFRGKRKDNGEWVYGYLVGANRIYVIDYEPATINNTIYFEIIPKTVGQYSEKKDNQGKEVWEGDIVKHIDYPESNMNIGKVVFDNGFILDGSYWKDKNKILIFRDFGLLSDSFEVIGNVFDNPNLLKEKE